MSFVSSSNAFSTSFLYPVVAVLLSDMGKVKPMSPRRPTAASITVAKASASSSSYMSVPTAAEPGEVMIGKRADTILGDDQDVHFYTLTYATSGSMYSDNFLDGDLKKQYILLIKITPAFCIKCVAT